MTLFVRGKQAVLFINLLGKGLTQEINGDGPFDGLLYSWFLSFFYLNDLRFSSRFMIHEDFWSHTGGHPDLFRSYSFNDVLVGYLRHGKTCNKKRAISFATWLQNELNSDVARFTTHENKPCNLTSCKTGSNMGGKTRNQEPIKWSLHIPYKPLESTLSRVHF